MVQDTQFAFGKISIKRYGLSGVIYDMISSPPVTTAANSPALAGGTDKENKTGVPLYEKETLSDVDDPFPAVCLRL